jgi:hypothetical protein
MVKQVLNPSTIAILSLLPVHLTHLGSPDAETITYNTTSDLDYPRSPVTWSFPWIRGKSGPGWLELSYGRNILPDDALKFKLNRGN